MPGRVSADRDDLNTQLGDWLEHKANVGVHPGLRCRPSERIDEDLAVMMALPPVLPDMDAHRDLRLPADHWVAPSDQRLLGAPQGGRAAGARPGRRRHRDGEPGDRGGRRP